MRGWIGVDLDGTLAHYEGWVGVTRIGKPVPAMKERVLRWIESGITVKIFTARVAITTDTPPTQPLRAHKAVSNWLAMNGFPEMEITCMKDMGMIELWDDRCIQVVPNTGEPAV